MDIQGRYGTWFCMGIFPQIHWDAMPAMVEGKKVMCMSAYGKEAYALYRKFSTKTVAHTIKSYSKFTIPYPYPVAQSIEAANGMEYPMICFNFGRCEKMPMANTAPPALMQKVQKRYAGCGDPWSGT